MVQMEDALPRASCYAAPATRHGVWGVANALRPAEEDGVVGMRRFVLLACTTSVALLLAAVVALADVPIPSPPEPTKECARGGGSCAGTDRPDFIYGSNVADDIDARAGADYVYAKPGNDTVYGGPGKECDEYWCDGDALWGGRGSDEIYGSNGPDELFGDGGDDDLHGGTGRDRLDGFGGEDDLHLVIFSTSSL
jgi:hypothetical protein